MSGSGGSHRLCWEARRPIKARRWRALAGARWRHCPASSTGIPLIATSRHSTARLGIRAPGTLIASRQLTASPPLHVLLWLCQSAHGLRAHWCTHHLTVRMRLEQEATSSVFDMATRGTSEVEGIDTWDTRALPWRRGLRASSSSPMGPGGPRHSWGGPPARLQPSLPGCHSPEPCGPSMAARRMLSPGGPPGGLMTGGLSSTSRLLMG